MSLLVDLSSSSLDPGYAEAAARRGDGPGGARPRPGPALALGVLAATLLIVIAAVQAHVRAPAAGRTRADLAASVTRQAHAVDALAHEVAGLRAAVGRLRDTELAGTATGAQLSARIRAEEIASGTAAVTGPGVEVTLGDAPGNGATSGGSTRNRVLDRDLQAVVNALWAAGAEAVAVDGQRLTASSAIRQAGDAILINFTPVSGPYRVQAVGDPVAIETAFAASATAGLMRSYSQLYGLRFDYSRETELRLPAAAEETLRYAHPVPSPTARGGHR